MKLDSTKAQRLVDGIDQAAHSEDALTRCSLAWDFLLAQFHLLCDQANGYPRNPIDGQTWSEGHALAQVCDRFADAAMRLGNRSGEEQAAGLATAIACQVVGHYPEEIFPRVLRTAKCREANGKSDKAIDDYLAILMDFRQLDLARMLDDEEPLQKPERCVLTCVVEAIAGLERLSPDRLGDDAISLKAQAIGRCAVTGAQTTTEQVGEIEK